jgi:predicted membrane protein
LGPSLGIILVAVVVFFAVNSSSNDRNDSRDTSFSNTAILTGIDRRITSPEFQSGDASAFMGGMKLDFRDATMKGNEATLDVSAIMGGVEIRIPRDWTVVNRVTPILGGIDDHTRSTGSDKRLIIEGTVLMGGLEIKN